jgi:hypothetical protein
MKSSFVRKNKTYAEIWIPPRENTIVMVNISRVRKLFFPAISFPEMADIDVNTARSCEEALKMAANFAAQASQRRNPKGGVRGIYVINGANHKVIRVYPNSEYPQIVVRCDEFGNTTISIPCMALDIASANQARTVIGQAVQDAEQMRA